MGRSIAPAIREIKESLYTSRHKCSLFHSSFLHSLTHYLFIYAQTRLLRVHIDFTGKQSKPTNMSTINIQSNSDRSQPMRPCLYLIQYVTLTHTHTPMHSLLIVCVVRLIDTWQVKVCMCLIVCVCVCM